MSITTIDGLVAGAQAPRSFLKALTGILVAFRAHSLFYTAGIPGPGSAPTPGIGGEVLTTLTGQIPFTNPSSGNTYLSRFAAMAPIAGQLVLADRLWQNSGLDVTLLTEQTFTSSAQIPARDMNGANAGDGVFAGVEVSTQTGAGTPTLTLKYTNESNVAGKTATNVIATAASAIAGSFYQIGLAAGDKGIRKAESLTLSGTWTSGTIHVVLYRVIATLDLQANIPNALDALSGAMARMYDNSVPFLFFIPVTTTSSNLTGSVAWAQG